MDNYNLEMILNSKYNIDVVCIEKNEESTDGNVYIMYDSNQTGYALKVYDNIKHAKIMTGIHTYVNQMGLKAPKIITNNSKEDFTIHEDIYIVCYSFAEGVKLKEVKLTDEIIKSIASYLKKLHTININEFNLEVVPYRIDSDRQSVLHFDITKHNIFVNQADNKDNEICFIDFDDARFGPSVCDVAIALTNLFISKANGIDIHGMKSFIDAYYQDDKILKEKEIPLIKDVAIKWLQSIIDNPNFDTSTRAGLKNKLKCWKEINIYNLT